MEKDNADTYNHNCFDMFFIVFKNKKLAQANSIPFTFSFLLFSL